MYSCLKLSWLFYFVSGTFVLYQDFLSLRLYLRQQNPNAYAFRHFSWAFTLFKARSELTPSHVQDYLFPLECLDFALTRLPNRVPWLVNIELAEWLKLYFVLRLNTNRGICNILEACFGSIVERLVTRLYTDPFWSEMISSYANFNTAKSRLEVVSYPRPLPLHWLKHSFRLQINFELNQWEILTLRYPVS